MIKVAAVIVAIVAITGTAHADDATEAPRSWREGDHLTGDWGGRRSALADDGVAIDVFYATEGFADVRRGASSGSTLLQHVDAALTIDTEKLGLWPGGKLYALGQDSRGTGIDDEVHSAAPITNLEAQPYTQLTELFVEQTLAGGHVSVRIGKQDANRDFGTPRFGGNFINNNFGMFPTAPLPSYPTTGLGASLGVSRDWLAARSAVYEGDPGVGGFGLDTAFRAGAGYIVAGLVAATHGGVGRDNGTASVGAWRQTGEFPDLATAVPGVAPRTFDSDAGFFVQLDERLFTHPRDKDDERGFTVILRFGWAEADRTQISRYLGGSVAYHGLGSRRDDTVGLGAGYFTVGGAPEPGDEAFVEAFYKWRITPFASLQPDLQLYRHPSGDGPDALLAGLRLRLKL